MTTQTKKLIVRACIIAATFLSVGHCSKSYASPECPELTTQITNPVSKYDELIKYENWTYEDVIEFLQWTLFTPETEDEYLLKSEHSIISESAGYTK